MTVTCSEAMELDVVELGSCPANPFIGLAGEQALLQAARVHAGWGWFGVIFPISCMG